jgi:hypothetical protein
MRSILGLTGKFTMETRQAMFGATADAVQHNESEARSSYAAANLLRTSTIRTLTAAADLRIEDLLRDLHADPPGESAYDAFQHLIQSSASLPEEVLQEQRVSALSHPAMHKLPAQGFVALPMSRELAAAYQSLNEQFADAHEESVSPLPVLIALLETDSELQRVFERNGLTISMLRNAAS